MRCGSFARRIAWLVAIGPLVVGCSEASGAAEAETEELPPLPPASAGLESAPLVPGAPATPLKPSPPAPRLASPEPAASAIAATPASEEPAEDPAPPPNPPGAARPEGPAIAATTLATTVYSLPNTEARRLGYLRLGGIVPRDPEPVPGRGCSGKWYAVRPLGFVCTDDATTDLSDPLVRAASRRPALDRPMPYQYGFVRATAPQYLRIPTKAEQLKSEFKLEEHLAWFAENWVEIQRPDLGANDVPLGPDGVPRFGLRFPDGHRLSTQLSLNELFGGSIRENEVPFWLRGGRTIPNVSGFEVPDYAVFADRVRRKTGLSFVDSFNTMDDGLERRFAVTVDLRLIPTTKVKPDTGTIFHGIQLGDALRMPLAWVVKRESSTWKLIKGRDEAKPAEPIPRRALVPVTGKARIKAGERFYQTQRNPQRWLRASDVGIVAPPPEWPEAAAAGQRWIDVSLLQQTLVLYEGKKPFYATLVSTGQDRLGDPKTTKATPTGEFRIKSKHIAAAMDSEENSPVAGGTNAGGGLRMDAAARATVERLRQAEAAGTQLSEEDQRRLLNVKKGRHPEYGVTMRRGSQNYELRDVPWIQYFASGYALHGAYWHDVFGIPRSHGCINLAPIDARVVFQWTQPAVPDGWHGINVSSEFGEGTIVVVRE